MEQEMTDMKNTGLSKQFEELKIIEKKTLKQDESNSSDVNASLAIEPKSKPALPPITTQKAVPANNGPSIANYATFSVIVTGQIESCEVQTSKKSKI